MDRASLDTVESVVRDGKVVISADDSTVVAMVQDAVMSGRAVTFYLSRAQFTAVNAWYWTPTRIRAVGMEAVTHEEKARIESELGIRISGSSYSNRIECHCGRGYGTFEFVQQGIREHGREAVAAALELEVSHVLRVNQPLTAVCPDCDEELLARHDYKQDKYACCKDTKPDGGTPVA
ncbi:hypothetical protein [Streptomyces sudanensis]|uniref:hypothetical protein n=1 Tax=Streptomyces sudanensis TaxID=436397 RepID=UPI0020CF6D8E|nr:hypothetical protein [Streptomyces sudanensis]MCP9960124.1 hypothetical protein [Streptomyces sudanensis]MCP9989127.1 hypothetical protein [Streptomyces sudanensis]MCP9999491.1 hypothetical protein [Streptomyces sudanensis]